MRGIAFTQFQSEDVVRHPLVRRIVDAYERHDRAETRKPPWRPSAALVRAVRARARRALPARAQLRALGARGARATRARSRCASSDGAKGAALNREFRGKDYATNVLTFVYRRDDRAARSAATS